MADPISAVSALTAASVVRPEAEFLPKGELLQQQEQQRILAEVRSKIAESDGGASVQYRYRQSQNGELVVSGATVIASKTKKDGATTGEPSSPLGQQQIILTPQEELDVFGLTEEERQIVDELRLRDLQVRLHESLHHDAAGGNASGSPEFQTVTGPDGNIYAVGGHVNVQTTATSDPNKAARDAATLAHAATAPGDASAQDLSVARNAIFNTVASNFERTNAITQAQHNDEAEEQGSTEEDSFTPITGIDIAA